MSGTVRTSEKRQRDRECESNERKLIENPIAAASCQKLKTVAALSRAYLPW